MLGLHEEFNRFLAESGPQRLKPFSSGSILASFGFAQNRLLKPCS
jgi:hypothetical protein